MYSTVAVLGRFRRLPDSNPAFGSAAFARAVAAGRVGRDPGPPSGPRRPGEPVGGQRVGQVKKGLSDGNKKRSFCVKKGLDSYRLKHYSGEPITESGARQVVYDGKGLARRRRWCYI